RQPQRVHSGAHLPALLRRELSRRVCHVEWAGAVAKAGLDDDERDVGPNLLLRLAVTDEARRRIRIRTRARHGRSSSRAASSHHQEQKNEGPIPLFHYEPPARSFYSTEADGISCGSATARAWTVKWPLPMKIPSNEKCTSSRKVTITCPFATVTLSSRSFRASGYSASSAATS